MRRIGVVLGCSLWLACAALLRLDRPKDAIVYLKKAVAFEPEHKNHWLNLGVALRKVRRYDESITAHERAVDADPYDPASARNLAIAYRGAERYIRAVKKSDPDSAQRAERAVENIKKR